MDKQLFMVVMNHFRVMSGLSWAKYLLHVVVVATLATGCGNGGSHKILPETPDLKSLVEGNNAFALDLYQQLNGGNGNLFFSPFCIYCSLGMTYAGARGQTEAEMAKALNFPPERRSLDASFHGLLARFDEIQRSDRINLVLANSLWPGKQYHFEDSFVDLLRTNYDAGVYPLDFSDKISASGKVNHWIEQETRGKIRGMITPGQITPLTELFLCSGIYFDGKWQTQFKPADTKPGPFYFSTNQTLSAPMMSQFSTFKMITDSSNAFQLLELPYSGGDLSMIILLPSLPDGLPELEHNLTMAKLRDWLEQLNQARPERVAVLLPKFMFSQDFDLVSELKLLGMRSAFDANADLSGMDGSSNLFIAGTIHKAVIEVNEAGTRASAATWVETARKGMPEIFRADHPFLFLIRDNQSDCILFMGRMANPLEMN